MNAVKLLQENHVSIKFAEKHAVSWDKKLLDIVKKERVILTWNTIQ